MWCMQLFGNKSEHRGKHAQPLLLKRHFGNNSGVGCQQPWGCIAEDWTPVMDTQYRHLPQPPPPSHPTPPAHFSMAAELTDMVSQRRLMLPAHWRYLSQPTYSVHWQKFTPSSKEAGSLKTYQQGWERGGVTLIPTQGNLSQMLSSQGLYWQEKREQRANLFFALVIESGTHRYQNGVHLNTWEGSWSCLLQSA